MVYDKKYQESALLFSQVLKKITHEKKCNISDIIPANDVVLYS